MTKSTLRANIVNGIIRYPGAIAMRLRIIRLKLLGMRVEGNCWIRAISVPRNPWNIVISRGAGLDDYVVLLVSGSYHNGSKLRIGSGTYINRFTMLDASELIEVGSNCLIGPSCYITDHDHGTTSDCLFSEQPLVSKPVWIGNNVWIGAGSIILKGVKIGDGAVIGAGAVVTRDVGQGEKVVGIAARPIQSRMSEAHVRI